LVFLLSSFCLSVNAKDDNYSLNGLIYKAFNYHPSIKSSTSLLSSAKKGLESAKWQYFPTPSVSISRVKASTTDRSYFGDDKVIKLGLNQTLWAGGSRRLLTNNKSLPEESPCLMRRSILFCKDSCSCLLTENALIIGLMV
jgi:outer membrane protein TolC